MFVVKVAALKEFVMYMGVVSEVVNSGEGLCYLRGLVLLVAVEAVAAEIVAVASNSDVVAVVNKANIAVADKFDFVEEGVDGTVGFRPFLALVPA